MQNYTSTDNHPTPLPTDPTWFKTFNAAIRDPDPKIQAKLAKKMQLTYHCRVGELIWSNYHKQTWYRMNTTIMA